MEFQVSEVSGYRQEAEGKDKKDLPIKFPYWAFDYWIGCDALNAAKFSRRARDTATTEGADFGVTDYHNNLLALSEFGGLHLFDVSAANHGYLTSFFGQNVPNASVSIEFRDSVFVNARRGGFEILQYIPPLSSGIFTPGSDQNNIKVYPQPAHEKITVIPFVKENAPFIFRLSDVSGRVILSERRILTAGLNYFDLDISQFSIGVYIMEIISASDNRKTKVFVE